MSRSKPFSIYPARTLLSEVKIIAERRDRSVNRQIIVWIKAGVRREHRRRKLSAEPSYAESR